MTITSITYSPDPPSFSGNTVTVVSQVTSNSAADLVFTNLTALPSFAQQAFLNNQSMTGAAPNFTVTSVFTGVPNGQYFAKSTAADSSYFGPNSVAFTVGTVTPALQGTFSPALVGNVVNTGSSHTITITDGTNPVSGVTFTSSNAAVLPAPGVTSATGQTTLTLPGSAGGTGIVLTGSKAGYTDFTITLSAVEVPWAGSGAGSIGNGPAYNGSQALTIAPGASSPFVATGIPPITYYLPAGTPAGITINASTGAISVSAGTAAAAYPIYVIATNSAGASSFPVTVTVTSSLVPPTYLGATSLTINSGAGFTIPLSASGTGPFTYSLIGAPAGVSISGGFLVGTSAVTASSSFQIVTTGQASPADTDVFTLTVNPILALAITSASSTSGQHGIGATFQHTATGGTGPYTWSLCDAAGNALPASSGFSINPATGVETYNGAAV
jgi:large repetitive protein